MRIKPDKEIRVVYTYINWHSFKIEAFHRKLEDKVCGISGILVSVFLWLWALEGTIFISIPILRNWSPTVLHWWPWAVMSATVSISVVILHFHCHTLSIWSVPSRIHSGIYVYIHIYVLTYKHIIYIIYYIIINYTLVEAWKCFLYLINSLSR